MTRGCRVAAVKNSPIMVSFQAMIMGGSVLYAPLACCSGHIDDVAAVGIMVTCAPLPLC